MLFLFDKALDVREYDRGHTCALRLSYAVKPRFQRVRKPRVKRVVALVGGVGHLRQE